MASGLAKYYELMYQMSLEDVIALNILLDDIEES